MERKEQELWDDIRRAINCYKRGWFNRTDMAVSFREAQEKHGFIESDNVRKIVNYIRFIQDNPEGILPEVREENTESVYKKILPEPILGN